jgi:hypothetical protein
MDGEDHVRGSLRCGISVELMTATGQTGTKPQASLCQLPPIGDLSRCSNHGKVFDGAGEATVGWSSISNLLVWSEIVRGQQRELIDSEYLPSDVSHDLDGVRIRFFDSGSDVHLALVVVFRRMQG